MFSGCWWIEGSVMERIGRASEEGKGKRNAEEAEVRGGNEETNAR